MGAGESNYRARDDPTPFFNYELGGSVPIDYIPGNGEFEYFAKNFKQFFPEPIIAEREFCETLEHYKVFKEQQAGPKNPYNDWVYQLYVHIKKGYRVGLPYLENEPFMTNGLIPQLPPLRYRHLLSRPDNIVHDGIKWCIGTLAFYRAIQTKIGESASFDVCNRYFDTIIRERPNTLAGQDAMDAFIAIVATKFKQMQDKNPMFASNFNVNTDQSPDNNAPLLLSKGQIGPAIKIRDMWGKEKPMQRCFPTMWYRYKDSLYGDGQEKDPSFAIFAFPRFDKMDFIPYSPLQHSGGLSSLYNKPPDNLLNEASTGATYLSWIYTANVFNFDPRLTKQALDWFEDPEKKRWDSMRTWILSNFPNLLHFYGVEDGQVSNMDYLTIAKFSIFGHVCRWMEQKSRAAPGMPYEFETVWKNITIPYKWKGGSGDLWGGFPTEREYEEYRQKTKKRIEEELVKKKHGGETWGYDVDIERWTVMYSPKLVELREAWKKSWDGFGGRVDWMSQIPSSPRLPIPPTDMNLLPTNEYLGHIYNFMKDYPLPSPLVPGLFEESFLTTFWKFWSEDITKEYSKTAYEIKQEKQWRFYMIWVESNVNAYGKQGYVKPGAAITDEKSGNVGNIKNECPDIGILASGFKGDVSKVIHMAPLGLTFLFGDAWWNQVISFVSETFSFVIKSLRTIVDLTLNNLPSLLMIGGIIVGGYFAFQLISAEAKKLVG